MTQANDMDRAGKSSDSRLEDFNPVILRREGRFCVYLPEWRLSGTGETLEDAYRDYEQKARIVQQHATEFGLSALSPEPYPSITKGAVVRELTMFFAKVATGAFATILLVVLLLPNISAAIRHNLKEMIPKEIFSAEFKDPRYWAIQFPMQMNARLDRLKPEEEEQMRNEWNKLLGRTVPIVSPLTCAAPAKTKPNRP